MLSGIEIHYSDKNLKVRFGWYNARNEVREER